MNKEKKMGFSLEVQLIDIFNKKIYPASVTISDGQITNITEIPTAPEVYMLPGFVDAHVHIESSMLSPVQFARLAVVHGTVGTVSDPHEIANVLGVKGIEWMIENARRSPFCFCFGAPSCVPATPFETAGASISPENVQFLLENYPEVGYLAEVMNFPGVLNYDEDLLRKIQITKQLGYPVDGHAPGLRGENAKKYIDAGCQTDHECFTADEARDKLGFGMKILIREGSAARNFEALAELIPEHYENLMFCSDDKHPDSLVAGHINQLVARALKKFPDALFEILQMACVNPVEHYHLPLGLCRVGDSADFILTDNLLTFSNLTTYLRGEIVANGGESFLPNLPSEAINAFHANPINSEDLRLFAKNNPTKIRVIEALDGQLITNPLVLPAKIDESGCIVSDIENDILKIVVINRYKPAPVAIGFIKNFGLKSGALASSVAHDSHNIVAVGVSDEEITTAIIQIINTKGGISLVGNGLAEVLPLPIAGLMSGDDGYLLAEQYARLDGLAKTSLGSTLAAPFMSLSFMALLVIPHLKMSDLGLFDGEKFNFTDIEIL